MTSYYPPKQRRTDLTNFDKNVKWIGLHQGHSRPLLTYLLSCFVVGVRMSHPLINIYTYIRGWSNDTGTYGNHQIAAITAMGSNTHSLCMRRYRVLPWQHDSYIKNHFIRLLTRLLRQRKKTIHLPPFGDLIFDTYMNATDHVARKGCYKIV